MIVLLFNWKPIQRRNLAKELIIILGEALHNITLLFTLCQSNLLIVFGLV